MKLKQKQAVNQASEMSDKLSYITENPGAGPKIGNKGAVIKNCVV